ncbi:MAG: phosphotransferase enzyme family protein [Phycisphaerae bacterium]
MPPRERETFDAAELGVVLSYYDLGVIESITEFRRGSRRSPKVGIVSEHGKFILKRRAPARANPDRVLFAHRIQLHLTATGFPVARLIATKDRGRTTVELRDRIYEMFEFVAGEPFDRTAREAYEAGVVLARYHQAMTSFHPPASVPIPFGDYHDSEGVRRGLYSIGSALSSHDSFAGDEAELAGLTQRLFEAYDGAVESVNKLGFARWREGIIHADWHSGNLLYRKHTVVAVLDYDSARRSRRIVDVANGALQFSIIAQGDPATWPDELDEERFRAFLAGFESLDPLSDEERSSVLSLMAEALVAECVHPIAETGSLGPWAGYRVLCMVERKLAWLKSCGTRLISASGG